VAKTETVLTPKEDVARYMAAAVDAALDGVALLDLDARFLYVNRAGRRLAGCEKPEAMIGRPVTDFIAEDDLHLSRSHFERIFGEGGLIAFELRARQKSGQLVPLELTVSLLRGDDGEPRAMLAFVRDATERKRAEESLRDSEAKYRALFENLNDAAFLADAETGIILETNKQAESLLGRTRDEIVGMHQSELHPPGKAEEYRRKFETHVDAGRTVDFEAEVARKDGSIVPVTISSAITEVAGRRVNLSLFQDVTERKRVEEALLESREKLSAIIENAGIGIALISPQMEILELNRTMREWFPLIDPTTKPICYRAYNYPPREAPCTYCPVVKTLQDRQVHEAVTETPAGSTICSYRIVSTAVTDAAGRVVGAIQLLDNITDRTKSEERLRAANDYKARILETSMDGFLVLGTDGIVREVNNAVCEMTGCSREELLRMNIGELVVGRSLEETRRHVEEVTRKGGDRFEVKSRRKDGQIVDLEISARAVERSGERQLVAFTRDITRRKRAEQALQESERKFRTLLENLPQKIFYKDRQSIYVSCNENYARDLEISPGEIAGKTDYDFYPEDFAEKYRADDKRVMDSGTAEHIDEEYIEHGERRWVHTVKTAVRDERGEVAGVLGIFWDITEQRKAQQAQRDKNSELQSFVYTVSHDLRGPLVSVDGFAKLLADEYSERLDAQGQHYLERLQANASRMDSLLTDLLELSRVGRTDEPRQAVEVRQVVADALDSLAAIIRESGAQVKVADDLPTVSYSRTRLFQVFANLISNAIRFSRPGEIPQVEIGWLPQIRSHVFFVKDNGIGIEEGDGHKVFEIFSRLKQKDVEGTGIGLAIVKRIVENHGGEVGVDSVPGQGSTFWFTVLQQDST
jgi:PAS domain S-box-containing protein